jgi:signal transduction histidine kinase/CheY-like chemotaxis protein
MAFRITIYPKITWLLLFSIFSMALASRLIYVSEKNIEQANLSISRTYEAIVTIRQLLDSVNGPGSGAAPDQALDSLQRLTSDDSGQLRHIAQLRAWFHNPSATGTQASKKLLFSMMQEERGLLAQRKNINETIDRRMANGLVIARFLGFLFIFVILVQLNKEFTRRKKVQEQLVEAIREAEEAKQMQEQFLANMSHEIRTPMNGIKGMTDLLMDTPLSDKQHELTGIIKSSVNNLLVIINDILDFSKIKAGKLNIEKIAFSPKEALASAIAIFEHRLKKKGLPLHTHLDPAIPDLLTGDPHRLNQILINLIGNAIKFTDQGNINVAVALQKRSDAGVMLSFTITDTGVGIPAEALPYIFDSFSQAGGDTSRRYGGTGLGLTICKQLVHLQGGEISATSTTGKGSVFNFYLPYAFVDSADVRQPAAAVITDYSNLLTGKNFLVAEDNEINQKLIDYVLTKAGGTVEIVSNGAEAIKYLKKGNFVDLIIMDLQMPEMDGYAATQYIRNDLHLQTPIIAMTATAMKGEQLQCLQSGMNEYLTKPFEFADLYKRINGLLS